MRESRSAKQLKASLKKRLNFLMVNTLMKFEELLPEAESQQEGQKYKGLVRTIFNEAIRATSDELNDYEIDFRPLRVTDEAVTVTRTFMETVECIEFLGETTTPHIKIYAGKDKGRVLAAIRAELDAGIVYSEEDGSLLLNIAGLDDCVQAVPAMDRYRMLPKVREQYVKWREGLVALYRGQHR